MKRGMRQKSRRRNSGEDVKIMIELEIELENCPMSVLLIVLEIVLEIELEIELEQGQEFVDHGKEIPDDYAQNVETFNGNSSA